MGEKFAGFYLAERKHEFEWSFAMQKFRATY